MPSRAGVRNLSRETKRSILRAVAAGVTQTKTAEIFGVSKSAFCNILKQPTTWHPQPRKNRVNQTKLEVFHRDF